MLQKQPSMGTLINRCSENKQQIYRRTPMPKCDFNKVAEQSSFIEIALRHGCSPVNLMHIFRTLFSKNPTGGLLLMLSETLIYKLFGHFKLSKTKQIFYQPSQMTEIWQASLQALQVLYFTTFFQLIVHFLILRYHMRLKFACLI